MDQNHYTFLEFSKKLEFSEFYTAFSGALIEMNILEVTDSSTSPSGGVVEIKHEGTTYELSFMLDYNASKNLMAGILAVLAIRKTLHIFKSTEKLDYLAPFYQQLIEALNKTELCDSITQERKA